MIIIFGIQTEFTEFRPLLGKWSEFRPAQKNQTRVATVTGPKFRQTCKCVR